MKQLAILLSNILLGWLVVQVLLSAIFLLYLQTQKKSQKNLLPDEQLPKTAVIICLRGADPFLADTLRALLRQNYPRYDLKVVVDSINDPAWEIATQTTRELGVNNVQVSTLKYKRNTCSLKCSSLIQAVSELDITYQVVALVDADTVVHPNWLKELVSPLAHPKVGATTGNRWYVPNGRYWGTLVRYLWNVSAVVQMYLYGIPWGGSLAIKRELFFQAGLLEKWGVSYADDTMIRSVLEKHGLRVKFVPSLIMLNREECKLPSLTYWLRRQLLSYRLYHPLWLAVVGDTFLTILLPNSVLVLLIVNLFTQQWQTAIIFFSSYTSYILGLTLLVLFLQGGVQKIFHRRGESVTELSLSTIFKILIGTPLTQWVYAVSMISSWWMPTVHWRGVEYKIKGKWNIKLIEYRPFSSPKGNNNISL